MRWASIRLGPSMRRGAQRVQGHLRRILAGSVLAFSVLAGAVLAGSVLAGPAQANGSAEGFARSLNGAERASFEAWYSAQVFFDAAMDAYWDKVEKLRAVRREKRRDGREVTDRDYATDLPPSFEGPALPGHLSGRWQRWRDGPRATAEGGDDDELPGLDVYLANAQRYFRFAPERIAEREFKRRYAREALAHGLTKDQVVRIYALETGGRGTADMQAGINPITGKGKPISSALGYAQLLAANSINVLSKHGHTLTGRLAEMVRREPNPVRRGQLQRKLTVLRRMVATAKSVPYAWARHVAFSRTAKGQALHVMNIDGVIGPWMQVVKIADLKAMAERSGRAKLSGAEIELMNLAGPGTGLEMMTAVGLDKPTTNFFSRRAYYRNTVVRGKDSSGLLAALEERMEASLKQEGAREFLQVFDELLGRPVSRPPTAAPKAFGFVPYPFQARN